MLLSTKDRIRNGPQPISNLMSYSNRCCHQLLSCHQWLARHQSLAHHQSLLCQAFPHEPLLDQAFPHVEPLLETSSIAKGAVLELLLEAAEGSVLLMSMSGSSCRVLVLLMSSAGTSSRVSVLLMSSGGTSCCILSAS